MVSVGPIEHSVLFFFLRDLGAIAFVEYTHLNVHTLLIGNFNGLKIIDNE